MRAGNHGNWEKLHVFRSGRCSGGYAIYTSVAKQTVKLEAPRVLHSEYEVFVALATNHNTAGSLEPVG